MKKICLAFLVTVAAALPTFAQTYGLGMGAASGDSVIVKINGKDTTLKLGTSADTTNAEAFLKCLVTDRVIKVERSGSTAKLYMLDKNSVASLLNEYLQSNTSTDACAVGKAAYTPHPPALANAAQTAEATPAPKAATKKTQATKKVSRTAEPAAAAPSGRTNEKVLGEAAPRMPATGGAMGTAGPKGGTDPSAARLRSLPGATVETPQTSQTSRGLNQAPTSNALPYSPTTNMPSSQPASGLQPAPPPAAPPVAPNPPL